MCALLFFATTISYVDRQVLSLLAKTLEQHIGWTASEYGSITSAFAAAYAIGLLGAGRLLDKFGTRVAFAIAVAFLLVGPGKLSLDALLFRRGKVEADESPDRNRG